VGTWTLGPAVGTYTLAVRSSGQVHATFTATVLAGPPAGITLVGGNNQFASVGERLPLPLVARVVDAIGNPVAGVDVIFRAIAGGSIEVPSAVTGPDGIASSGAWTLGPTLGTQQVSASAGPAHGYFRAISYNDATGLQGRLAFQSSRDGNPEIYTINADGTGLERLTTTPGFDGDPSWSPDGSRIAFRSDRDDEAALYVMDEDGSNLTRLPTGPGGAWQPAWSPDGSVVAFVTANPSSAPVVSQSIATVDVDNGTVLFLTDDPGYNGDPSWSPDGLQLAFVSDRAAYDFVEDIYTMKADGTEQHALTQGFAYGGATRDYYSPAWSPDGSMIAFIHGNWFDKRYHVAVMSADGTFLKDLAWAGESPGSLAWSPDGDGVAYTLTYRSGTRWLNYVSLDGSQLRMIVTDTDLGPGTNEVSPSWRP